MSAEQITRCPLRETEVPCCLPHSHRGPCKYKCAEPSCPGLIYPASVVPHRCSPSREHPLSTKLYKQFKAGSRTLTKDEAWTIANELDRLHVAEVEAVRRSDDARKSLRNAGFDA